MSIDLKTRAGVARPRLSKAGTLARFALSGVDLAAVAETFGPHHSEEAERYAKAVHCRLWLWA
jgi:hypothetical protein